MLQSILSTNDNELDFPTTFSKTRLFSNSFRHVCTTMQLPPTLLKMFWMKGFYPIRRSHILSNFFPNIAEDGRKVERLSFIVFPFSPFFASIKRGLVEMRKLMRHVLDPLNGSERIWEYNAEWNGYGNPRCLDIVIVWYSSLSCHVGFDYQLLDHSHLPQL